MARVKMLGGFFYILFTIVYALLSRDVYRSGGALFTRAALSRAVLALRNRIT